jgi:hypothetical protein
MAGPVETLNRKMLDLTPLVVCGSIKQELLAKGSVPGRGQYCQIHMQYLQTA